MRMKTQTNFRGWKLAEGAGLVAGLGYSGTDYDRRNKWNRLQNVNIRQIEMAPNLRVLLSGWNANTAEWLRYSIYNRIYSKGSQNSSTVATMVTFLLSAFWHGYYPGYYLTFLGMAWLTDISRNCRKYLRPLFLTRLEKYRLFYDISGWFFTQLLLAYNMPAFVLRRIDLTTKFYATTYYHGHIIFLLSSLFFLVGGGNLLKYFLPSNNDEQDIKKVDDSSEEKKKD